MPHPAPSCRAAGFEPRVAFGSDVTASCSACSRPPRGRSGWPIVRPDVALLLAASKLEERRAFSFWDALVVEAARRGGATRLLTEGLRAGRRIGDIRIENPFA
jgi:hypothetical protein